MEPTNQRISAELERKMDEAIGRYPVDRKRSAAMPLLHLWQEEFDFISDEGVRWIAAKLELQPINILELVTFYPMFRQAPAGKTHIRVCRTLSCAMAGSYQVMEQACAAAGIRRHRDQNGMHHPISVSKDGNYSIEFVECLASCGTAPVCMVQDDLVENVRPEMAPALVKNRQSLINSPHPPPHPLEHRLIF
ncbi:MAG TPA: NAD(P)H-dependent oxidoreductase subunit E, partial [Chthoniobacterales bacterium]